MNTFKSFESQLYKVNVNSFSDIALRLFRFQAEQNPVYKNFIQNLGLSADKIRTLHDIPYLPISFFKSHTVKTATWKEETIFTSSGTTGSATSLHPISDLQFYLSHSERCFEHFFGTTSNYHFLALLPSYLERKNSSLVAMIDFFIRKSGSRFSSFYLEDIDALLSDLKSLKKDPTKTILWGVTFALLDLAEAEKPDLSHCLVFETGGMKGRRSEITRQELHSLLCKNFNVKTIYSEYGMTELLSQCYSKGNEKFYCPPWVKVIGRDLSDPFQKGLLNETAGINIIDLANWHSVAFIETEDLGKIYEDGSFEVLGRLDNSDIRGCNLMVE